VPGEKKELGASNQFRSDERGNERAFAVPAPPPPPAAPAIAPPPAAAAETVTQAAASPPIQGRQGPAAPQQTTPTQTQVQQAGARQQRAAEPSAQQAQLQTSVTAERPAAGAAGGAAGGIVSGRLAADAADSLRARKLAMAVEVVAPSASARWRVVDGRVVQRSSDAGTTWADQFTANAGVELTVGSAPSPTACWFVGRAGVVIRTADGRTWTRAKFPEQVDLVSVTAADAQSASVTTVDGRVFATTDGGATWRRR
jgi:hypothetical protein